MGQAKLLKETEALCLPRPVNLPHSPCNVCNLGELPREMTAGVRQQPHTSRYNSQVISNWYSKKSNFLISLVIGVSLRYKYEARDAVCLFTDKEHGLQSMICKYLLTK